MTGSRVLVFIASFLIQVYPHTHAFAEYRWPLEENLGVSGTFGEFRGNHLHAGVDLSTNGKNGLPVVAVDDGHIVRMKIQKRNYGRAIYVQHADKTVSVYAHLDSFSTDLGLEQLYQRRVAQWGTKYVGDIFVEPPIAVKKGEIIAYSGETGGGLPHLHFELRRDEVIAVNPLRNGFKDEFDPTPPTFQAVYLYPLTSESAVDGDLETREFRLQKQGSIFTTDHVPVVRGDFMASVSVYDSALRPYRRAPNKVSLSIDQRPLYSLNFNAFSYVEEQGFGLAYDLGKPGASYFEYPILLQKFGNTPVPFVEQRASFSTKNLSPGSHLLQIEATDSNDNRSVAHVQFMVNRAPSVRLQELTTEAGDLLVKATVNDPDWSTAGIGKLAAELDYSVDAGKNFSSFPSNSISPESSESVTFQFRVPLASLKNAETIFLKLRGYDGLEYSPYLITAMRLDPVRQIQLLKKPQGKAEVETYSNAIKVVFHTDDLLPKPLEIKVGDAQTYPLQCREPKIYEAIIPAPQIIGPLAITFPDGQQLNVQIHYHEQNQLGTVRGENYELKVDPSTFYWNTFIWTKSLPAYSARSLPPVGPLLQLSPHGLPMRSEAILSFDYPRTFKRPERLSVYIWDRATQRWRSMASQVDSKTHQVRVPIAAFSLYALLEDNIAPTIAHIFPKRRGSSTSNRTPTLAATLRDTGMGINDERITFFVDGVRYDAEYDPDRDTATTKVEKELRPGYHKFWIVAEDYAGNRTQSSKITFRVK